jgi:hypothetical protein
LPLDIRIEIVDVLAQEHPIEGLRWLVLLPEGPSPFANPCY